MTHRVEQLAEGVVLHLGDCRENYFHPTTNGSGPYLASRKCTALQGRQSNSRSATSRIMRAICRWKPRPFREACSFPPPPFLWLISSNRGSSQPQRTHATLPRPTKSTARRRYPRSYSVERPFGGVHDLSLLIFGSCWRLLTSRSSPHFGQRSRPKPENGFHVHSHLRQWTTALVGVFPHGARRGLSASNFSMWGVAYAR